MTWQEFDASLSLDAPAPEVRPALAALWWDSKGEWHKAHSQVDDKEDPESMWVHAYLHRKEGVEWNASYWYGRAGKKFCPRGLEAERQEILESLLLKAA